MRNVAKTLVLMFLAITGLVNRIQGDDGTAERRQKMAAALNAAREEFMNGVFLHEEKLTLADLFLAEQAEKTASKDHDSARSLAERKVITPLQLEAAAQAVQSATKRLEAAKVKLNSRRESMREVVKQFDRLERMILEMKDN
jgi:glutathione S-transferase